MLRKDENGCKHRTISIERNACEKALLAAPSKCSVYADPDNKTEEEIATYKTCNENGDKAFETCMIDVKKAGAEAIFLGAAVALSTAMLF